MTKFEDYLENLAKLDFEREHRAGKPEAIFCEGKPLELVLRIAEEYKKRSKAVLFTRLNKEQMEALKSMGAEVNELARTATFGKAEKIIGSVAILTAGSADVSVAEEASVTASFLGLEVLKFYDVGVAGLHRIIEPVRAIREKKVDSVIVIAGMEGALPSVVAGLVDVPVIAVPTSVGYGVHLKGISTLFAMLQSCPSGVAVVNVDNGFGAAVFAYLISKVKSR
ncbi:MAG: nickel pincer cofactor biosynthesis protein LarB [Archaeoglobales archaeon]|jgi:NCAIR mutase (PurE)-related protein|nr:nickel pincer cofactor biosynthesis protein LarB [Archaeoglobi archaeon]NHW22795.1 nickel pincer cofactor biosynthesis protein LarB [Archaeoglobales archaeon]TDA30752.1 MAG: nickel pincer cofactor biosynthesis protein LarB [Archaeoglobi archaeon]